MTQNQWIGLFQMMFFFMPALFFLRTFDIQNACNKKSILKTAAVTVCVVLVVSIILNMLLGLWALVVAIPPALKEALIKLLSIDKPYGLVIDLFTVSFIPAVCEEFFFRGVVQTGLSSFIKPRAAIITAAFFFAFYHLNPWFFPFFFVLGVLFGYVFLKTRNLGMAVLAHFVNNAFGVVVMHLYGPVF
ncbi:MAG: CPBP family intramembrane metalloprotease [Deltaproteobacteria bacterium]|nr:CPBP family intramembrane metalloprotease [Deltaproteobacteria bacterium]